jgi:DNA processing protein
VDQAELAPWLRLALTGGVGPATARKLLAAFGPPACLFAQSQAALSHVVQGAALQALLSEPEDFQAQWQATQTWLAASSAGALQRTVLTLADAHYPSGLLDIEDPPLLLYVMGRLDLPHLAANSIAIVGSRNPSPQGSANARQFAKALHHAGVCVVSGLALGVDAAAHAGALEGKGAHPSLATIAVVGTGLDRVYPKANRELAHQICENGWMVSEYHLGTPPLAANFPRRNRLIAGLSSATLVVEAALQSGSLITARLAAEQGKEVFAIPGSIHSTQSRGCHALIRQGAKLVESAQDILEEMKLLPTNDLAKDLGSDLVPGLSDGSEADHSDAQTGDKQTHAALVLALGFDPVSLDALQARTGLDTAQLQAALMALELDGTVARLPGGLFQRQALA